MKLLNWQTKGSRTSGPTDLQMAKDPKLGRPSRLEENDQEESKLAKSNHFLPRKLLIDGNKSLSVVYVSNEISLSGLNKMYTL